MSVPQLLEVTRSGLYCAQGDFYIDPQGPVGHAVITHAHGDHARFGSRQYLCHTNSVPLLRHRLGEGSEMYSVPYGEELLRNGVKISLHPAGHIVGSAQVRLEYAGEVWVVSGDYKLEDDGISAPFEPIRCDVFISECTFGLPIFHWTDQRVIADEMNSWWRANRERGVCSLLLSYTLGKAQRLLKLIDSSIGPIYAHGATASHNDVVRNMGFFLPPSVKLTGDIQRKELAGALVLAPPSAFGTTWLRRLEPCSVAFASGWMTLRGIRRRKGYDKGFVVSDHADWSGLISAIRATGASRVLLTHGYTSLFARYLREELHIDARELEGENQSEGEVSISNEDGG